MFKENSEVSAQILVAEVQTSSQQLRRSQHSDTHIRQQLALAKQQSPEVQVNSSETHRLAFEKDREQLDTQVLLQKLFADEKKKAVKDGENQP